MQKRKRKKTDSWPSERIKTAEKRRGGGERRRSGRGQTVHQPAIKDTLQYVGQSLRESDVRPARRSERKEKIHTHYKKRGKKPREVQRVSGPTAGRVERASEVKSVCNARQPISERLPWQMQRGTGQSAASVHSLMDGPLETKRKSPQQETDCSLQRGTGGDRSKSIVKVHQHL